MQNTQDELEREDEETIVGEATEDANEATHDDAEARHWLKVFAALAFWGLGFLLFYNGGPGVFKSFVSPMDFENHYLFYGAAAFVAMVVCGANTLACIVIGHRKNANLFMLFIAVSFISIFVVLSLFGAVFSFFAGQATTPYRRQDDDW